MRRRAFLATLAAAAVGAPRPARAQDAPQALDEVDRFRAVLTPLAANVAVRRGDALAVARMRRTESGLVLDPGGAWTAAEPVDDMPARLLAAFCGAGPLAAAVGALGYELGDEELGFAPTPGLDGHDLVRRVGGPLAELAFEPSIFRPRALRIGRDETRWSVVALTYGTLANGWFPERLDVRRGDETVASLALTDAAPSVSDLSPLATPDGARNAATGHYPRIPL